MASSSKNEPAAEGAQGGPSDADLAQAFKDLARGEKTAQALEANLTNLEKKIDDLLASFEKEEAEGEGGKKPRPADQASGSKDEDKKA